MISSFFNFNYTANISIDRGDSFLQRSKVIVLRSPNIGLKKIKRLMAFKLCSRKRNVIKLRVISTFASPKSSPKERTLTSLFFKTLFFGEGRVRQPSFSGRIFA